MIFLLNVTTNLKLRLRSMNELKKNKQNFIKGLWMMNKVHEDSYMKIVRLNGVLKRMLKV